MRRALALTLVFATALASDLRAQSTNASLTGRVTDLTKAMIVDARVAAISASTNSRYETTSNGSGEYYLSNLPPSSYRIEVEKSGFTRLIKPDVILHVQDALEINFELKTGSVSETITVEGGTPLLNTESATVSTVIDRPFVENLPLNGRSFQTLIMLTPGVVVTATNFADQGQFSVNGQRADANYPSVDGVSANRRSLARIQPFRGNEQPGVGGCHAGVSHSNIFICSGVRTHSRWTDLDRNAFRNECLSWNTVRIFQEWHARCER